MTEAHIQSLLNSMSKSEGHGAVRLISTHISWVILTHDYAYKIKKPISFSFLDFSDLESRQFYCQREWHLNRRLAPQMYLDVIPVIQSGQHFFLDQQREGTVVDYALKMHRMDTSRQMDLLLEANQVQTEQIDQLADQVVVFHQHAEVIPDAFHLNTWQQTFNDLSAILPMARASNLHQTARVIEDGIDRSNRFLQEYGEHFLKRQEAGWIIDGHGDLHAKNIFLTDPPVIFDCIEFSDELRQLDVLNEVAFFCMDMDAFDKPQFGERFLERYSTAIPCLEHPKDELLFNYFKLYRCNVRLKVNGLALAQTGDQGAFLEQVDRYTHLFGVYLDRLSTASGL